MDLDILAVTAAAAVVQAASTDAWTLVSGKVAGLLSRGDRSRRDVVEHQLLHTREMLGSSPGKESAAAEEQLWAMRLADLLAERPETRPELQNLVDTQKPRPNVTIGPHAFVVLGDHNQANQTHNHYGPSSPPQ
ncbi:hypothetical protein [Actinoplanes awajinensis]|uniref:hypothetical protein n=1 Tax=Actinoplanes awajinensis TaxID=135946 RepID=UPI000B2E0BFA|nr:hypothetical protein [Actinoplanes awajinensis]